MIDWNSPAIVEKVRRGALRGVMIGVGIVEAHAVLMLTGHGPGAVGSIVGAASFTKPPAPATRRPAIPAASYNLARSLTTPPRSGLVWRSIPPTRKP